MIYILFILKITLFNNIKFYIIELIIVNVKMPRIQSIYNQLAFVRFVQYASPLALTAYAYISYQKKKHIQNSFLQ